MNIEPVMDRYSHFGVHVLRFYLSKGGEMLVRPSVHEIRSTEHAVLGLSGAFQAYLEAF